MHHSIPKRTLFVLSAALLVVLGLSACVPSGESETEAPAPKVTEESTKVPTEPETAVPTVSDTESPTELETAAPTESDTEAPTEPETEPVDPTVLNADALTDDADLFRRTTHCVGSLVEDSVEGRVIRLASDKITSPGAYVPDSYLDLQTLAKAAGLSVPATTEYPYLVLKVKTTNVWSRLFSLYGGTSIRNAKPGDMNAMLRVRLKDTADWQYVYFDLSSFKEDVSTLFIQFEYGAGKNGEALDIAEARFFKTEEEAIALCGRNAYEVEEPDDTLRIISYNIWVGNGTDTTMRADIFCDFLDEYRPDSIGMQEVNTAWLRAFESFAFNESYAGVGEGRDTAYEACLIYYRTDKYELVDSGTFWLSDTPDVKGSKFPDSSYPRICTWVHLRDRVTGYEYVHVNTHLDHLTKAKGHALRGEQIKVLLNFVNSLGDIPIVMTGDFNSMAQNSKGEPYKAYAYITGESFRNAAGETITSPFADTRLNAAETVPADATASMVKYFDKNGDTYQPDRLPIDYQFYTPKHFEPLSYNTFIRERDGVPVSDHLALVCEYRIPAED